MKSKSRTLVFLVTILMSLTTLAAEPYLDPASDDEYLPSPASTGSAGPLFWQGEQQIAGFRNIDKVSPTREIARGDSVKVLPNRPMDFSDVVISSDDQTLTLDEYFLQNRVGGLIAVKDGNIVYERYGLGNDENTRWVSFSVAKSVVAMLYGAAIKDGFIANLDEKVTDYLPRLRGSSYQDSTIRNLLQMASGVEWNEDYADPNSDVATASWETLRLYEFLRHKPRAAEAGELFNYNTAETNLAGTLLRSAIGNNLATYLSDKIWAPYGMEADASWQLTEPGGGEFGGCCINATLRDYARIGLFALDNGVLSDGTEVLPGDWMEESTTPSIGYEGYGYFWWLNADSTYQATGIFGQGIYIDEAENVVIAIHSARESASRDEDWAMQDALYRALTDSIGDRE